MRAARVYINQLDGRCLASSFMPFRISESPSLRPWILIPEFVDHARHRTQLQGAELLSGNPALRELLTSRGYRTELTTDGEKVTLVHFYRHLGNLNRSSHVAQLNLIVVLVGVPKRSSLQMPGS
jgi:hypothetical protein